MAEKSTQIVPVTGGLLTASWRIITIEHVYEADALQIASCKKEECDIFVSADQQLLVAAKRQRIQGFDPEKDQNRLTSL
jgi:predicted nucleic acid-binding protein